MKLMTKQNYFERPVTALFVRLLILGLDVMVAGAGGEPGSVTPLPSHH